MIIIKNIKSISNKSTSGKLLFVLISIFLNLEVLQAQNPVIPDIGMSDPHMRVFNDTLYLFCGHDSHPDDTTWVMKEWRVFSSTNLLDWKMETTISPKDNYMDDNSSDCWAGDAASRNDSYYFYFSDRKRGIGVMQADHPGGPYRDALGKPLVAPMHDPTILIDHDKNITPFMVYGDKEGSYHVVQLNNDMISLAEEPKPITIIGEEWEKAPNWMDKNYIFKHKNTYYLSWGRDYATAENIYGPYKCVGAVGQGHHLNEYAHGSFFHWKGQFYHMWCYYLRQGFKFRESIITYCHFDDQGRIITDTRFLDQHFSNGVGQYRSDWDKIETEWFYQKSNNVKKTDLGQRNFGVMLTENDWIRFAAVKFPNNPERFLIKAGSIKGEGVLEARSGDYNGDIIARIPFSEVNNPDDLLSDSFKKPGSNEDIYLIVKDENNAEITLDWFRFE